MSDIPVSTNLGIGAAVAALKNGLRVRRAGWNGQGMWLSLTPGKLVQAQNFWSRNNREYAEQNGGEAAVHPYVTIKNAQGAIVPWAASQGDLLADDWEILPSLEYT